MNAHSIRRFAAQFGLLASLVTVISMTSAEAARKFVPIPKTECLPDTANACSGYGMACCAADTPCTTYCDGYSSPGQCLLTETPNSTCRLAQNVSCGLQMNCNGTPVLDGNGKSVPCGGAPDNCLPGA